MRTAVIQTKSPDTTQGDPGPAACYAKAKVGARRSNINLDGRAHRLWQVFGLGGGSRCVASLA